MGAMGQIGSVLTLELRSIYGISNVIASDIRAPEKGSILEDGIFEKHDCRDNERTLEIIRKHKIKLIYKPTSFIIL